MTTTQQKALIEAALNVRKNAYTPYSGFKVGAALLGKSGKVYTGCNVESATYSPTNCAERTAIFKAVSEGETAFDAIAVVGGKESEGPLGQIAPPCGVCRQMLFEFCDNDMPVIMAKTQDDYLVVSLGELLPYGFGPKNLL